MASNSSYAPPVCPRCGELMESLGNIDNSVMTTNPPQWDELFVCHQDKVKMAIRRHGEAQPHKPTLSDYEWLP